MEHVSQVQNLNIPCYTRLLTGQSMHHRNGRLLSELLLFLEAYNMYNKYIDLGIVWVSVFFSSFEMGDWYASITNHLYHDLALHSLSIVEHILYGNNMAVA